MSWSTFLDIGLPLITIIAIIVGPIAAVIVTRKMDRAREDRERRLDVFRSLMKTRQVRLDPLHVSALNLIELEFYGSEEVIVPYRAYIKHLSSPIPETDQQDRYFDERHSLFVDLLQALGSELGYSFDKHELERLGYAPSGWWRDENVQRKNALMIAQVLEGKRPFPITVVQQTINNPFPPPPMIEDQKD